MSRFTVIRPATDGSRLYKLFEKDDKGIVTRQKESPGTYFKTEYREFNNFGEMCAVLAEIEEDGNAAILRGDLSAEVEQRALAGAKVRRIKFQRKDEPPSYCPVVREWVMLDVDKHEVSEEEWGNVNPATNPEAAIKYIISKLPYYFKDVSCYWQFSASQGVFAGYRTISVHLFYLLDRTVSDHTMRRWAESQKHIPGHLPIDQSLFDCIQPHYLAPPRFKGISDPLSKRSGVYEGERTMVYFDVPVETNSEEVGGNIHPLVNMRKLKPYLDVIGDDVGRLGFSEAIKSTVGKYFQLYGPLASDLPLKTALRKAVEDAPKKHDRPMDGVGSPLHYASDEWLDPLIRNIRNKEQTEKESEETVYQNMLKRYVYVEEMERFLDLSTLTYRTKMGVTDAHTHETQKLAENILCDGNLKRVSRMTYKPGSPAFCEDYDPNTGRVFRAYNRWTPSTLAPQDPKMAGWFVDHLNYLCDGDGEAFAAIVSWCAHLVQFPDEKINFGILLQGAQGTGKSFLSQILSRVLGPQNTSESVTPAQVMSPFTEWMSNKQLVTIEEIRDRDEKYRIYEHMKTLITGETVRINPKGLPAYDIPNRTNFICYTNHVDAVPMDEDDRRFIIKFSNATPQNEAYYNKLGLLVQTQCGAVLQYLREVDLKGFNPKGRAPMTSSKREFMQESGSPIYRWLKDGIAAETFPLESDMIVLQDIRSVLPQNMRNISSVNMSAALRKVGAENIGQCRLAHGKMHVWAVRNHEKWKSANESKIIEYYQKPVIENGVTRYVKPTAARRAGDEKDF